MTLSEELKIDKARKEGKFFKSWLEEKRSLLNYNKLDNKYNLRKNDQFNLKIQTFF